MGAAASIPDQLDKETAKLLAGVNWDEAAFDTHALGGFITRAQAETFSALGTVGTAIADGVDQVTGAVSNAAPIVGELAGEVVESAFEFALDTIGAFADVLPMLRPLGSLFQCIARASVNAKYNKVAARMLCARVKEVALALAEVLTSADMTGDLRRSKALHAELTTLQKHMQGCKKFIDTYQKRGYLSKLLKGHSDEHALEILDKGITDTMQSLSVTVGTVQMQMQARTFEKLTQVTKAIERHGGARGLQDDDAAVCRIAELAGVPAEELRFEMQDYFAAMMDKQDDMDRKLDQLLQARRVSAPRAAEAGAGGGGSRSTATAAAAAPAAPGPDGTSSQRVKRKWHDHFGSSVKNVSLMDFVLFFESEFNDDDDLPEELRAALPPVVDLYPFDGSFSYSEYKKFFKKLDRFAVENALELSRCGTPFLEAVWSNLKVLVITIPADKSPGSVFDTKTQTGEVLHLKVLESQAAGDTFEVSYLPADWQESDRPAAELDAGGSAGDEVRLATAASGGGDVPGSLNREQQIVRAHRRIVNNSSVYSGIQVWEWHDEDNFGLDGWKRFDDEISAQIQQISKCAGVGFVEIRGTAFEIDCAQRTQKLLATGHTRQIRCVSAAQREAEVDELRLLQALAEKELQAMALRQQPEFRRLFGWMAALDRGDGGALTPDDFASLMEQWEECELAMTVAEAVQFATDVVEDEDIGAHLDIALREGENSSWLQWSAGLWVRFHCMAADGELALADPTSGERLARTVEFAMERFGQTGGGGPEFGGAMYAQMAASLLCAANSNMSMVSHAGFCKRVGEVVARLYASDGDAVRTRLVGGVLAESVATLVWDSKADDPMLQAFFPDKAKDKDEGGGGGVSAGSGDGGDWQSYSDFQWSDGGAWKSLPQQMQQQMQAAAFQPPVTGGFHGGGRAVMVNGFAGGADVAFGERPIRVRSVQRCPRCRGNGKTGMLRRKCMACGGSGSLPSAATAAAAAAVPQLQPQAVQRRTMRVQVPLDGGPGLAMDVISAEGLRIRVTCPANHGPGSVFCVAYQLQS
jgi:hypothetical protein